MILTATAWQQNIRWEIVIELTTVPTEINLIDDFGTRAITSFSQAGNLLTINAISRSSFFKISLNTETKIMEFGDEGVDEELQGNILAPSISSSNRRSIYLPLCDVTKVEIDLYRTTGEKLVVQNEAFSPFWEVYYPSITRNINGISTPCLQFELTWTNGTRYLSSAETNTWNPIMDIPIRAVATGVTRPNVDWRAGLFIPNELYNKQYYADFS